MPEAELDPERRRLADDGGAWRRWGPYLSERAWGTVREDYSARRRRLDLVLARPGPLAGVPLERGRARWDLRRPTSACAWRSRSGTARPDPQGADLRPHRATRATTARTPRSTGGTSTPRRRTPGCAGATSIPSAPSPTRTSSRRTPAAGRDDPEYELLDTDALRRRPLLGHRRSTTRRPAPDDLCLRVRVRNAGPDAADAARAPDAVVPQPVVVGPTAATRRSSARTAARSWRSDDDAGR